jgi:hypothetical protein
MDAEAALEAGERYKEFDAYNQLGLYFEQSGMLPLAAFHYRRCLTIAAAIDWLDGCMASNLALGLGARLSSMLPRGHAGASCPACNSLLKPSRWPHMHATARPLHGRHLACMRLV